MAFLKGEIPLQDQRGRHSVHYLLPLFGVLAAVEEDVVGVDGGAALIPEDDLQPGRLPQQRAEGGAFLGPGPLGAIHVPRVAQHQQLYAALGKLKKEYRETLFLVYFEELSYRQAAQVLGRTEQQVTNLVYRGKQQLKQLLEQEGYQYEN